MWAMWYITEWWWFGAVAGTFGLILLALLVGDWWRTRRDTNLRRNELDRTRRFQRERRGSDARP